MNPPRSTSPARAVSPNRFGQKAPTPSPGNPRQLFASNAKIADSQHSPYSHRSSVIQSPTCPVKFLVTDCPSDETLKEYIPILRENNVRDLIRISQNVYDKSGFESEGVRVWDDLKFEDGTVPNDQILEKLRNLIRYLVLRGDNPGVAVHCVSGIGRAPLFATITFIDYGMDPMDAIELVRSKRRGCLNKKQVDWLLDGGFKPVKNMPKSSGTPAQIEQALKIAEGTLKAPKSQPATGGFFSSLFGKK